MNNLDPQDLYREPGGARKAFPETLRAEGVAPEEQDAVWALLEEWKPGQPSTGFDDAVMARIRAGDGVGRESDRAGILAWLRGFRDWLAGLGTVRGFGLAGALAMVLLAAVMLRQPTVPPEEGNDLTAGQEFTAQQVETALEDLQLLDELYSAPSPEDAQNRKI